MTQRMDMLELVLYIRLENPPTDYILQKGSEVTLLIKLSSRLMRGTPISLRSSVVAEWCGPALTVGDAIIEMGSMIKWNHGIQKY